jgi:molybdopterin-guanine dinucleotide biosynthesis protein A
MRREDLTGLVLAGGRGSRMGGLDKGLQPYRGVPLALHALRRLQPQVGQVAISANRHLDVYRGWGVPVWPDTLPEHPGPLAGFLAGLARCDTAWLVCVPCDTPEWPPDLVERLGAAAARADAELALPVVRDAAGHWRPQPAFCLLRRTLHDDLSAYLQAGGRKIGEWARRRRCVEVPFPDARAFDNLNTLAELQQAQAVPPAQAAASP